MYLGFWVTVWYLSSLQQEMYFFFLFFEHGLVLHVAWAVVFLFELDLCNCNKFRFIAGRPLHLQNLKLSHTADLKQTGGSSSPWTCPSCFWLVHRSSLLLLFPVVTVSFALVHTSFWIDRLYWSSHCMNQTVMSHTVMKMVLQEKDWTPCTQTQP